MSRREPATALVLSFLLPGLGQLYTGRVAWAIFWFIFTPALQARGQADIIADLAYPLPVNVIAEMLGIPAKDHEQFRVWSDDLARSLDLTDNPEVYNRASRSAVALTDYLREIIANRRRQPQNDLLSALIAAEEDGGRLTEDELYAT